MAEQKPLDQEDLKILGTLVEKPDPATGTEIASSTGIDSKVVTKKIKDLKTQGLIDSPARCKYSVTEKGKAIIF